MEFSKDIRIVDNEVKLSVAIYIYLVLFKKKENHLADMELGVFTKLLLMKVSNVLKKGAIKVLAQENKSVYTYIDRIKGAGLLKKEGDDFLFPPDMLKIAETIVSGKDVVFTAKLYGES